MPPDPEAIAEQVFAALADPTRRAILAALASGGPATATDLAESAAVPPPRTAGRRSPSIWPCWPRRAW
jgi:DNA-binding transcriptional ArsR family regulator